MYSENITQQTICRVISQQMLYFSQHFVEKFCLENACRVMFTDICCHLTDMTFLRVVAEKMEGFWGTLPFPILAAFLKCSLNVTPNKVQ